MYTADLIPIIERHDLIPHLYADDTQICGSCHPTTADIIRLRHQIENCVLDVAAWMSSNRLQLNMLKTEVMWLSSPYRRHQVPSDDFTFGTAVIKPVDSVRDLGLYVDATMSFRRHITQLSSTCFGVLRQIRTIKNSLPSPARTALVTCFVFARLDYCNAMFAGLPKIDIDRLQSIQNAAVRLISNARQHDHITPLLREKHWLPVQQRITFKLCVMMYRIINNISPVYLRGYRLEPSSHSSSHWLRSSDTLQLSVPRSRTRLGDRAFAVAGPKAWNSLPMNIQTAQSLNCFKKHLKTFLFFVMNCVLFLFLLHFVV
jgi:hypothetical protein